MGRVLQAALRLREPPHLVNATTRPTPCAGGAAVAHSTSRRDSVPHADTQPPRPVDTTGVARPSAGRPPARAVAATLRTFHAAPRTDSVREPTQRRRSQPTKLML